MEPKSKSQIKREMKELQQLGEKLLTLSPEQLNDIDIPDELREEILLARRVKSHGARRRQLQYIGALMRRVDPEPIYQFFKNKSMDRQRDALANRQVEIWRDGLIEGSEAVLESVLERFPDADIQHLRQLIRNSKKTGHEKKSSRALFRYLKKLMDSASPPPESGL